MGFKLSNLYTNYDRWVGVGTEGQPFLTKENSLKSWYNSL